MKIYSFLIVLFLLSGCKTLEEVQKFREALFSNNGNLSSSSGGTYIEEHTKNSVAKAWFKAKPPQNAKQLFKDMESSTKKVIELQACNASTGEMKTYADNRISTHGYVVLNGLSDLHHKSGCFDVLRINKIQKKAANAIKFAVYFISPQSEKTQIRFIEGIKQQSEEWLFNYSIH